MPQINRVLDSREFQNPRGPLSVSVTYECHNGLCRPQNRIWTILWPLIDGLTLEMTPTCDTCGGLLTITDREKVTRPVRGGESVPVR